LRENATIFLFERQGEYMIAVVFTLISLCLNLLFYSVCYSGFSILDETFRFTCSPNSVVGCEGIFPIKEKPGSEFAIVKSGEDAFALRAQSILEAKKSIRIQSFIFRGDEAGLHIAELLMKRKKKDDLDIKIVVDAYFNPALQTQGMYYDLKLSGIEVEGYETGPLEWINEIDLLDWYRGNKRFHDKMWVVDGETKDALAFVGGINIANEYFRVGPEPEDKWRDQDVALRGAIVKDTTAAFDRNYEYLKRQKRMKTPLFNTDNYWRLWRHMTDLDDNGERPAVFKTWSYSKDAQKQKTLTRFAKRKVCLTFFPARARFVQSRPRFKETYITQTYINMIKCAEKEIIIVNAYFIPSKKIIAALKNAAEKRGVAVTILTNSKQTNNHGNAQIVARASYCDLLQSNRKEEKELITIYEWRGDLWGEGTLHAKFAIFDRMAVIVGAYNLDPRGDSLNSETAIVIENFALAAELRKTVLEEDLKKSQKISMRQAEAFEKPKNVLDALMLNTAMLFKNQL